MNIKLIALAAAVLASCAGLACGADDGAVQLKLLPEGAMPLHTTLDSGLLRVHYGLEVPDVWDVVERVAANTRDQVASPTHA